MPQNTCDSVELEERGVTPLTEEGVGRRMVG